MQSFYNHSLEIVIYLFFKIFFVIVTVEGTQKGNVVKEFVPLVPVLPVRSVTQIQRNAVKVVEITKGWAKLADDTYVCAKYIAK